VIISIWDRRWAINVMIILNVSFFEIGEYNQFFLVEWILWLQVLLSFNIARGISFNYKIQLQPMTFTPLDNSTRSHTWLLVIESISSSWHYTIMWIYFHLWLVKTEHGHLQQQCQCQILAGTQCSKKKLQVFLSY